MNVEASAGNMEEMLKVSGGQRMVPVIVEGGVMVQGFGGS